MCGKFGIDAGTGFLKHRKMVCEFGGTAAGKNGDEMRAWCEIVLFAKCATVLGSGYGADQWMADEFGGDARVTKKLLLEGEDTERFLEATGDELGAPRTPSPELRADVVDVANTSRLEFAGEAEMETGKVGEDGECGLAFDGGGEEVVHGAEEGGEVLENFGDADDGDLLVVHDDVDTGGAH